MKHRLRTIIAGCVVILCVRHVRATDRYFPDISEHSPSKRYNVEATSPDNRADGRYRAFQSNFTFTCNDTSTGKVLWTRKQPTKTEGSPTALFVSDTASTVIWTGWDQLICVDRLGGDRGTIDLLKDAFSEVEIKDYVQDTTAGPMWAAYSLWYFLEADNRTLFVIRPWWGRRVLIDVLSRWERRLEPTSST